MRIVRYEDNGFAHVGLEKYGIVHSLPAGLDVLEILRMPLEERNRLAAGMGRQHRVPLEKVRLLPPIEPRAMRDFVAFEQHIAGMKKGEGGDGSVPDAWYEAPAFLFMNPWSLTGPNDDIPMPPFTNAFDFELEVAAIVGSPTRDVTPEEARERIVGYAIFNDWSARDIQGREMQVGLGPSKGKDFANTLGPWITTPDELEQYRDGDRLALDMTVSVNGEVVGRDNLSNLAWSFEELVAHAARDAWVGPGDVIASGTCSTGSLAELWARNGGVREPRPLQIGDVVSMTVQGLGTITNRIVEPRSTMPPVPSARRRTD